MDSNINIIVMKPKFIRMMDGTLVALEHIMAIPPSLDKIGVSSTWHSIRLSAEDMKLVLDNIDIINDKEQADTNNNL